MPTAIIPTYTGDGFVIAADGMADGTTPSLTKRKIFKFGNNRSLAYAFSGRVAIGPHGPDLWFDFRDAIDVAVQALSVDLYTTLSDYAKHLADHAYRVLIERCTSDLITFDDATELGAPLARVFVSGYFKQVASNVIIEFYRENRQFAKPKISDDPLVIGEPRRHGSHVVDALFAVKSPIFFNDRYLRPLQVCLPHFSEVMKGAVLYSRAYIEACGSEDARNLDPFCKTIGGKIHMASITPTDGIRWVPGFEHADKL